MTISDTVRKSLVQAYKNVKELGETGKVNQSLNPFGNTTFLADVKAGEAVFEVFKDINLPVIFVSEEHGKEYQIGDKPKYLAVIDELDGSLVYKFGNGKYGTMVSVFNSLNPKYEDYLVSGIVDHSTGDIYIAEKGKGTWCNQKQIFCSDVKKMDKVNTQIRIDGWFEENIKLASKLVEYKKLIIGDKNQFLSSSSYYMDLVSGKIDLVIECTRKRNLELAVAYGLIIEAGGVMTDVNGQDLGGQLYLEFGQGENDHLSVISSSTKSLGLDLSNMLKSSHA